MTENIKLSRPPIIEALVDIQIQPVTTVTVAKLRKDLPASFITQFPNIEEIKRFESSITQNIQGTHFSSHDLGTYGLMLRNQENTKVAQVRVDGFALSHLHPYDSFDHLKEEAQVLWQEYQKLVGVKEKILKVVLRYINIIECHRALKSFNELGDFLKNIPLPPKGTAPELNGFNMELVSHDKKVGIYTTVRRGLLKNLQTHQHGISVDIEVVKQFAQQPNQEQLWSEIELLRPIKNDIFFDVVSDKKIEEYR